MRIWITHIMSPNTPTKQHHDLRIRSTYLGEYQTLENKERGTFETVPVKTISPSNLVLAQSTAGLPLATSSKSK